MNPPTYWRVKRQCDVTRPQFFTTRSGLDTQRRECPHQQFITSSANARQRWLHRNVRRDAHRVVRRLPIVLRHSHARERHHKPSAKTDVRNVAIRASCCATNDGAELVVAHVAHHGFRVADGTTIGQEYPFASDMWCCGLQVPRQVFPRGHFTNRPRGPARLRQPDDRSHEGRPAVRGHRHGWRHDVTTDGVRVATMSNGSIPRRPAQNVVVMDPNSQLRMDQRHARQWT